MYNCTQCKKEYVTSRSFEEARDEYKNVFKKKDMDSSRQVCEPCYKEIMAKKFYRSVLPLQPSQLPQALFNPLTLSSSPLNPIKKPEIEEKKDYTFCPCVIM